jgi:glycosyltransferase involved in cell wall biosynthesis
MAEEELPEYFRVADLYLSASHSDGSSVSLMEALACGLPAAVSDIPANQEWVKPGEQGWLFPDGDTQALAEVILRATGERSGLKAMSEKCRAVAEARADWSRNFPRLFEAYRIALEG